MPFGVFHIFITCNLLCSNDQTGILRSKQITKLMMAWLYRPQLITNIETTEYTHIYSMQLLLI